MKTEIKFASEARQELKLGVDEVANAVKVSMGAEGRTVIIPAGERGYITTKDGVSIARSIDPVGKFKEIGASLVKEAAGRTNSKAGDGTTTASVLVQEIFNTGLGYLEDGASAIQLKRGMESALEDVLGMLDEQAVKVSKDNLKDVTSISVNGDKELGELIANAFSQIGEHGLVITKPSDTRDTTIEVGQGIQLDNGFIDPIFVTDNIKYESVLENPFLLLYKGKIERGDNLVEMFNAVWNPENPNNTLVIICDDIDPFVFSTIRTNVSSGAIKNKVCVVGTPQILKVNADILSDIATMSGAKIVSSETGVSLGAEALGRIDKFIATATDSILIGNQGKLSDTIEELKARISNESNDIERKDLQERLSRINGGVATLHIGASTDSELIEKRDRIEDGINATRAALEEGIIAGGGVTLANIGVNLLLEMRGNHENDSFDKGYALLLSCLAAPYYQILSNAGLEVPFEPSKDGRMGIDVSKGSRVDMIKAGIVDPKKVTKSALTNAVSVAGAFLTTEAVVARN